MTLQSFAEVLAEFEMLAVRKHFTNIEVARLTSQPLALVDRCAPTTFVYDVRRLFAFCEYVGRNDLANIIRQIHDPDFSRWPHRSVLAPRLGEFLFLGEPIWEK